MTKIAVTGPRGRLGSELVARHGCTPIESDVTDFDALSDEVGRIDPSIVIHTAAYDDVDGAEKDYHNAVKVNVRGTGNIRIVCKGHLIAFSTPYVFDGTSKRSYLENDDPKPIGAYGWSKYGAEVSAETIMRDRATLLIRTVSLYGHSSGKSDFVSKVLANLRSDGQISAPSYLRSNPIYVPHLAEAVLQAASRRMIGRLNIAGLDIVSRYEWACLISRMYGYGMDLVKHIDVQPDNDYRPREASLNLGLAKNLKIKLYSLRRGLEEYRRAEAS
jgi:dTDP-4-dehydrorhamnose reductase